MAAFFLTTLELMRMVNMMASAWRQGQHGAQSKKKRNVVPPSRRHR